MNIPTVQLMTLSQSISKAIRELLETKHLYQSTTVDNVPVPPQPLDHFNVVAHRKAEAIRGPWSAGPALYAVTKGQTPQVAIPQSTLNFDLPHARMFCRTCDRIEPFNPEPSSITGGNLLPSDSKTKSGEALQIFSWAFTCQGCKGPGEVMLIRREGFKLTLCGRAPIEHIETPSDIPKSVAAYYSGAIIAHQSGQTLAGLFMLRTCIEQWMRKWKKSSDEWKDITALYQTSLPDDFKQRFPSLPNMYTEISTALHAGDADSKLFDATRRDIVEHFEARRLYRLTTN